MSCDGYLCHVMVIGVKCQLLVSCWLLVSCDGYLCQVSVTCFMLVTGVMCGVTFQLLVSCFGYWWHLSVPCVIWLD